MLKQVLLVISILLASFCSGQHFHFKNYSLKEGLSRSGVYYILQDNHGFLWIGTEGGGISKFDGYEFKTFNSTDGLNSEHVRVIFEDQNNALWFGTDNGLSFFEDGKIVTLTSENGLSDNFIRSITQDSNGNLWVGTNRGISIIDPSEKEISSKLKVNFNLPHKKVRSVLADSNVVWVGTDAGLCKIEDSEITVYNEKDGLVNDLILNLFIDSKHQLWIGTNGGLTKLNNGQFQSWTEENGLINNRIRTICEDDKGRLWLGTKKGISRFNDGKFTNITGQNGLSNERIRCIHKDRFGNIWIGSFFGGIMRYNDKDFISYSIREGLLSNQVLSLSENENGEILVGSFEGSSCLKVNNNHTLDSIYHATGKNGLKGQSIRAIHQTNDDTFFYGTDAGLNILSAGQYQFIGTDEGLISAGVTAINHIGNTYYIGTDNGISEITFNEGFQNFSIKNISQKDGLAGNNVSYIKIDQNDQIWIGFLDGQISILANNRLINPKLNKEISQFSSLAFGENNTVWLGTNGRGLFYGTYNSEDKTLDIKQVSIQNGLSSNSVFSLLFFKNRLWIGHEKGLDVLSVSPDSSFLIVNYGLENGFSGLQNNINSSYADSKGNLWFGTVNGLFCMNNSAIELSDSANKPINYIQSVYINNHKVDWAESDYCKGIEGIFNLPVELELPYNINTISFDFVGLNFVVPEKIKYTWRLKGFESDFRPLNRQSNCDYTNLEPGKYIFELKSTNENGEIIDEVTTFKFTIKKPFWQTWWFRILAVMAIISLLVWYLDYRTKQLLVKQKKLEETIAVRTEEIVIQNNELEQKNAEIEEQHAQLTHKNQEITDSILYSRRIQRSLLPSFEKMKSVFNNYFVLYKPKDIVSGDFYWVAEPTKSKSRKIYFAVADCTGHGVPGAMVSLVCTRALNSSLLEYKLRKPKDILEKTNAIVLDAFTDHETGKIINDGMDIALGFLDYSVDSGVHFSFSGAQNSAWIILPTSEGNLMVDGKELLPDTTLENYQLFVLPGAKQPIGNFEKRVPFPQHSCILPEGAKIYLYTDGYADQFGGKTPEAIEAGGKKFKYKPLKNLLLLSQDQSLSEQKKRLFNELENWRQNLEQVDDICIMCLEV